MSENEKIACIDADVIIKMNNNGSELFEIILDIFTECYLHNHVYKEVKWPKETVKLLDKLIATNVVKLITDKDLYNRLKIKKMFIDSLQQVCNIFGLTYEKIYYDLENYIDNEQIFFEKLKEFDKNIDENLGEIRTLQMIILLREIEWDKINYFISDDRRACNSIILKYGSTLTDPKLYGISLISSLYLLKQNGYTKNKALKLIENLPSSKSRIFYEKNRMDKMDNKEIINNLYEGNLKLLKNGDFLLK